MIPMRRYLLLVSAASLAIASMVTAACTKATVHEVGDDDDGGQQSTDNGNQNTTDTTETNEAGETTGLTGLPCDVEAVLQNNCTVCHGPTATDAGGPPPLIGYDDMKAMATADPTKTRAELSVQYMTDHTMPKPPAEPVDPDEITTIANWIDAGYPENSTACTGVDDDGGTVPQDGGIPDSGVDAGADGGCPNGQWDGGDQGSLDMHPGEACIACHTVKRGPKFRFAGTVFPAAGEANDCNGEQLPVTVTITDKRGKTATATTNNVGNFGINPNNLQAPYTVKLTQGANTRAMTGTITAGDCNGCHQATGAPNRVLAPTAPNQ